MGCSCILLTWACRNRQGSITSRVAKFGKRIKETAIRCLADSMASIVPFQVHGHSAGRRKAKAAPAGRPPGAGEGAFSLPGRCPFNGPGRGRPAGRARPLSWAAAMLSVYRAGLSSPSSLPGRHAPGNCAACPAAPAASPSLPVSPRQQHRPICLMRTLRTQQAHPPPRHTQNNGGPHRQVTGNTPHCKKIFHVIS